MGTRIRVKIEGLEQAERNLLIGAMKVHQDVLAEALAADATTLGRDAQAHCPEKTGYLKGTYYQSKPKISPKEVSVEVGYHDPKASIVHRNKHRPPAQRAWLAKALRRLRRGFAERLVARVRARLSGSGDASVPLHW